MAGLQTICVAQYLRMSTEHQQYSIDNQAAAIQEYAREHGFTVVRTYEDPGRSGLLLRRRLQSSTAPTSPGINSLYSDRNAFLISIETSPEENKSGMSQ